MPKFSRDLGIDLGTANVLVYEEGRGIVLREPSVVAVDKNTGKVLQVGAAANNMLGRTPGNVVALRPLREGVISDYEMTEKMLAQFMKKVQRLAVVKPRVVVSVPSGITEVEERAVIQATMEAGARRVYLIEEPFGGTTDIAVLTMNDVAVSSSLKVAGQAFDEAVVRYVRRRHNVLIGPNAAEEAKITIGCVYERGQEVSMLVKGRDLKTGLPKEVQISSAELLEVFKRPARQIVDEVLAVLEQTSPELVSDISQNGIVLTGGGSQLWGFPQLLAERTGIRRRRLLRGPGLRQEPAMDQSDAGGHHKPGPPEADEGVIKCSARGAAPRVFVRPRIGTVRRMVWNSTENSDS